MRQLLVIAAALALGGCGGDPNVYAMRQADAYKMLRSAKVGKGSGSPFGQLETIVSGDGVGKVYWNAGGTFSAMHCEASITPEGSKSRIMAFCNSGSLSDGAAAGMVAGMERRALIEHIDAALTGRAFDKRRALGVTAMGWPADPHQPDGSYSTMVIDALKMDREMRPGGEFDRKMKEITSQAEAQARVDNPALATRPMTQLDGSGN